MLSAREMVALEGKMAILKGHNGGLRQPVLVLEVWPGGWQRTMARITAWLPDENQEHVRELYGTQRVDLQSLVFPSEDPTIPDGLRTVCFINDPSRKSLLHL
jgi:hypothetical protein